MAQQLVIRDVPEALIERLRHATKEHRKDLNETVLELLEEGLRVREQRAYFERSATWSEAEKQELDAALRAQRMLDAELWMP